MQNKNLITIKNLHPDYGYLMMGIEFLKRVVMNTANMDEDTWEASEKYFRKKQLKKKEYFLKQGEVCRYIGFISSGYVRLFYLLDDTDKTKDFNTEGYFCGSYASFITDSPSHFNVVAMEDVEMFLINKEDLMTLTDKYMAWQKFLRIAMQGMFIAKENREAAFLTLSPEHRYNNLMITRPDWINRIPLKYLASYLGLTAETISRIRAGKLMPQKKG